MPTTSWPAATSASARCEPMKPAAPVTAYLMGAPTLAGEGAELDGNRLVSRVASDEQPPPRPRRHRHDEAPVQQPAAEIAVAPLRSVVEAHDEVQPGRALVGRAPDERPLAGDVRVDLRRLDGLEHDRPQRHLRAVARGV